MIKLLSISVGELSLKGLNRRFFEDKLISQIRRVLKELDISKIYKEQGKIYIEGEYKELLNQINRLKKIFGLVYISPCIKVEKNMEDIEKASIEIVKEKLLSTGVKTFKVETKRVDKKFPLKSPEISRQIGGIILKEFPELKVDVHNPDFMVNIDIKTKTYIYTEKYKGYGGLPIGTNGRGLLLLSGGIDSPVAGFMMAKRGVEISGLHFHSYPFTSERAEEKVKKLAGILSLYTGKLTMYSINLLNIQKAINENCPEKEMTILSRRFMMRIGEKIANKNSYDALITGENLGQVASQTIEGISVINASVRLPILRPLLGFDKIDIIDIAKDIDTYDTSILPYEDCCTVFLPKHPVTRPKLSNIQESEGNLDIESLVDEALENVKIYNFG